MAEQHDHPRHLAATGTRGLRITLLIVLGIMGAEFAGGLISNSLALVGDAGHMLVDALAIGLSLIAIRIAQRPATATRTFGYHRVEIMAALTNGVILVLMAVYIIYEAYQRFLDPPEVETTLMMAVAGVGLAANVVGMWLLGKARHHSINVRAAFWHILGDTISSVGVIAGGVIISVTGWSLVDPIIAIVISCIILWGAVRLVRESGDVLMEATPRHIRMDEVNRVILGVAGVREVHDMHIWTITSGIHALSAHLLIDDQTVAMSAEIARAVERELAERYDITHTTLQLECERCAGCPAGLVCDISRPGMHADH
jgi:cobalt-zinc-cadmium efflux system protein